VLTQIYHVVKRKALEVGDDPEVVPKGETINLRTKEYIYIYIYIFIY